MRPLAGATSLAAVAAIAVAVMLTDPSETPGPTDGPEMFVEDYLRRAVGEDHIETNDPAEVRRFLVRELGLALGPIHFAGLDLSRAEICLLEGRRGAMIVYKIDGAEVSHYLVPRRRAEPRSPAVSTRSAGAGVGTPVVTWATPDVEQALVGEVSEAQLIAIAGAGSAGP